MALCVPHNSFLQAPLPEVTIFGYFSITLNPCSNAYFTLNRIKSNKMSVTLKKTLNQLFRTQSLFLHTVSGCTLGRQRITVHIFMATLKSHAQWLMHAKCESVWSFKCLSQGQISLHTKAQYISKSIYLCPETRVSSRADRRSIFHQSIAFGNVFLVPPPSSSRTASGSEVHSSLLFSILLDSFISLPSRNHSSLSVKKRKMQK